MKKVKKLVSFFLSIVMLMSITAGLDFSALAVDLPPTPSISKLTAGNRQFTVCWKLQTDPEEADENWQCNEVSGFEIQFSTDSVFSYSEKRDISNSNTRSLTVNALAGKTKYYVRIRSYILNDNIKCYSLWSEVKSVTTFRNSASSPVRAMVLENGKETTSVSYLYDAEDMRQMKFSYLGDAEKVEWEFLIGKQGVDFDVISRNEFDITVKLSEQFWYYLLDNEEEFMIDAVVTYKHYHSFKNYVSNNNATCTTNGTKTAKCETCDELNTVVDENSALGHSCTPTVIAPTCLNYGYTINKCIRCDYFYFSNYAGALGHSFDNSYTTCLNNCGALNPNYKKVKKPSKPTISDVKASKKSIRIKIKKISNATSYEIQYATNKSFKKAKNVIITGTSKEIKKLGANKKYFVRVRAINKAGKSSWSSVKTIKTKK